MFIFAQDVHSLLSHIPKQIGLRLPKHYGIIPVCSQNIFWYARCSSDRCLCVVLAIFEYAAQFKFVEVNHGTYFSKLNELTFL